MATTFLILRLKLFELQRQLGNLAVFFQQKSLQIGQIVVGDIYVTKNNIETTSMFRQTRKIPALSLLSSITNISTRC